MSKDTAYTVSFNGVSGVCVKNFFIEPLITEKKIVFL